MTNYFTKGLIGLALVLGVITQANAAGTNQPHHIGLGFGGASHDSKTAGYIGLDYSYRFQNNLAVFLFAENVSGDFDIQAYGFGLGKFFDSGWKIGAGPGVEKKLKSGKYLNLFHFSGGYAWHNGPWSYGPIANIDLIEDNSDTYYLGWSLGNSF